MSDLTPVEALQAEIDRVAGFPGMDELGPYYKRLRSAHLAAIELAKAFSELKEYPRDATLLAIAENRLHELLEALQQ